MHKEESKSWEELISKRSKVVNRHGIPILPKTLKARNKLREIREREKEFTQDIKIRNKLRSKLRIVRICAYCGTTENLTMDHRIPLVLGGPDHRENLIRACKSCNKSKGGRLLESDISLFKYFLKRDMIVRAKVPNWVWQLIKEI